MVRSRKELLQTRAAIEFAERRHMAPVSRAREATRRSLHRRRRAPADVRGSYLAGFADEMPFGSSDAFDEVTGRLADAGADEVVFYFIAMHNGKCGRARLAGSIAERWSS
jgi:hypothetical protein